MEVISVEVVVWEVKLLQGAHDGQVLQASQSSVAEIQYFGRIELL